MNIEKKIDIKNEIRTAPHDRLRYKKANKKKFGIENIENIFKGFIKTAFGIALLISLMTSGASAAQEKYPSNDDIVVSNPDIITPSENALTSGQNIAIQTVTETQLTHNAAKNRQPVWSSDGQWIGWVSTMNGDWDIFKMRNTGDGTGFIRLTTYPVFDLEPSWVNNKIVFARGPAQHYEDIWIMNSDGTNQVQLTHEADFDEYPDLSPDGTKIAYSSMGGIWNGSKQIWVMNADGSGKHKLNNAFGFQSIWSPDGTKIAFKCYGGYNGNICVMNSNGTGLRQLTFETANTHWPHWSPDGRQIAFASKRDGDWEIYVMNADGSNIRQLTSNTVEDNYPDWSPDGTKIVFSSTRTGIDQIWVMNLDGISSNSISVVSPNGGENWLRSTTHTITWGSVGNPGTYVKIELLKAGVLNRVINSSTPNDGSYNWIVPNTQTLGSDYKIRITSTSNPIYTDTSNNNFMIGGINVISPNGGENWARNTGHTISWSSLGSPGTYVKIELFKAGVFNRAINSSTPNDGSYYWTVPSIQTTGIDYKVKITSTSNSLYVDSSNNNFVIS